MEKKKEKKLEDKKEILTEKKLGILVAIFLGLTTLLVAWSGWIGSLHSGIQAINFTKSNNLAAKGNSEYNVSAQVYISDVFSWNTILSLKIDLEKAKENGNKNEAKAIEEKLKKVMNGSCSPKLLEYISNTKIEETNSPFENDEFSNSYFKNAKDLLNESQAVMEEGKIDNLRGDSYRLVSVIYSLVLFLLGLVGIQKDFNTRKTLFIISVCILFFGIIYMLTIPMPTGFDLLSFFNHK